MAKKTAKGISKSQAIRDYLKTNPKAGAKQIVEDLKAKGVEVSLGLANVVKYSKKVTRKRGRPAGSAKNGKSTRVTMDDLLAVKRLTDELGGTAQVRHALETLERLR